MAQSGYTPVLLYASGTTGNTPSASNLTSSSSGAELALNYYDGKLFYKDNTGTVQVLATKGAGTVPGSNTQVIYNNNGALGASSVLTFDGTTLTSGAHTLSTGNLTFGSTSQKFLADFTNATVASRLLFQTSTANSTTGIYAVPSGTATAASWQATNAADPTNASKILIATNGTTDVQLVSGINGTGTYLPLSFYTNGSKQAQLDTSGNFTLLNGSLTLSAGTANGVLYLNGSKAVTSGSALAFDGTTLTANTLNLTNALTVPYGGTGLNSLTAGYIPFGSGTSAFSSSSNLFWDNSNIALGVGYSNPNTYGKLAVNGNLYAAAWNIQTAGNDCIFQRSNNDGFPPATLYRKSRGSIASPTSVNNGDGCGVFYFSPYDGSNYLFNGVISAVVNGTVATNSIPVDLTFSTGSNGSTERMRINAGGSLLVGTTSNLGPGALVACYSYGGNVLHIQSANGSANNIVSYNSSGTATFSVSNSGAVSKTSGSFRIEHPLPQLSKTHQLVHSFIEGPQADLIYRGTVQLVNGNAVIDIDKVSGMTDGTFVALCREIQCFTSNETGWTAVKGNVQGNILTITAQDSNSNDSVSWMVIGERQDKHMFETDWTDSNGKVIVEPLIPSNA